MEMIEVASPQDINNYEEDIICVDNVTYKLSDFVFPSIFYSLQKSKTQQKQLALYTGNEKSGNTIDNVELQEVQVKEEVLEEEKPFIDENVANILPNFDTTFITLDSWSEEKCSKSENKSKESEIKISEPIKETAAEETFNDTLKNDQIGPKQKRKADLKDKDYCNNSKVTKYHDGDKGSNQKYSNVLQNCRTLYSDYIDTSRSSSRSSDRSNDYRRSNNDWESNLNLNQHRINRFQSDYENEGGPSNRYINTNTIKSDVLMVREEWQSNSIPDPHLNLTFRQSILTKSQIDKMRSVIKRPSNNQSVNNRCEQRCHLPTNLLNNRINHLQKQCNSLDSSMNDLQQQKRNIQYGPYNRRNGYVNDLNDRIDATLQDLVQIRGKLGKLEEMQRDISLMYGDMLLDGNYAKLSDWHEYEIRQQWDRLDSYEHIYGRKNGD